MSEVFYHGTSTSRLKSIQRYGLLPNNRKVSKPNWSLETDNSVNYLCKRNSIYLTTDFKLAKEFAEWCAEHTDGEPIVLEISKSALKGAKLISDENVWCWEQPTSFRVEGIKITEFKILKLLSAEGFTPL